MRTVVVQLFSSSVSFSMMQGINIVLDDLIIRGPLLCRWAESFENVNRNFEFREIIIQIRG